MIWGLHRDSEELSEIGFPVFSLGALPTGPQRLHVRPADVFSRATVGQHVIGSNDFVVADADGVLFLPEDRLDNIVSIAVAYRETEARQIKAMRGLEGPKSNSVPRVPGAARQDPSYGFRQHLKDIEAAGEV